MRVDRHGQILVGFVGPMLPRGFNVVALTDLEGTIERRETETLERLVAGRIVLLLLDPPSASHPTPLGPMSDGAIQAQLLNTVLTNAWVRQAPVAGAAIVTALRAALTAWLWLGARCWKGAVGVAVLALLWAASLVVVAERVGVLLRIVAPMVQMVVTSGCAFV